MAIIRCVMFDYGNVLVHFDTPSFYSFVRQHQGNCLEPHEFFSGIGSGIMIEYFLGNISDPEFFDQARDLFKLKGVEMGEFFRAFSSVIEPNRQMLEIKNQLISRGLSTVLITNIGSYHLDYTTRCYPEVFHGFDYKLISCRDGVIKPDPEAWMRPLEALDLKAEECIFIDDHYPNIEASCRLGIKGWHYDVVDGQFCPNGKLEEEGKRLKDFLALLDNLGLLYDKTRI